MSNLTGTSIKVEAVEKDEIGNLLVETGIKLTGQAAFYTAESFETFVDMCRAKLGRPIG